MKLHVLSDIDGVVANAVAPVLQELWSQFGVALGPADVTENDMVECLWPKVRHLFGSQQVFKQWMWRGVWNNVSAMRDLQPHWEEWAAMREIIQGSGDKLALDWVTARLQRLASVTAPWMEWWGMVPEVGGLSIYYCKKPKDQVYEERVGQLLEGYQNVAPGTHVEIEPPSHIVVIEDHLRTAERVQQLFANEERVLVLVPDRPWTRDWPDKRDFRLTLVELMGAVQ